ncbi:MAG: DUF4342 domain-containing protein [Anaerovoracaceae bacterium]|nr:DUF4342 domain-containing protein [Anaerovoracaceae bacterium]
MEITLEKIELVKDRTGASYKQAKEALEESDGSVVDAIISIEESADNKQKSKIGSQGSQLVSKIKELVKKGNVSKIVVKKEDEVLLNLPVNIGVIGGVLAPWALIAGTIAAFGTKCKIELYKDDGEVMELSDMAIDTFEDVKEKSSVIADEVKIKSVDVYENVKAKAEDALGKVSRKNDDDFDDYDCDCDCCEYDENCGCGCSDDWGECFEEDDDEDEAEESCCCCGTREKDEEK